MTTDDKCKLYLNYFLYLISNAYNPRNLPEPYLTPAQRSMVGLHYRETMVRLKVLIEGLHRQGNRCLRIGRTEKEERGGGR